MYCDWILVGLLTVNLCWGLTPVEFGQFKSRSFVETNSGLQGSVQINGTVMSTFSIFSNGIPDHKTGTASSKIKVQSYHIKLPTSPSVGTTTSCLPIGPVGMAINGIPIFNAYSHDCCDTGKKELGSFDNCWGLVDDLGRYHYSTAPLCLLKLVCNDPSGLIGVAFDGFPIYGPNDETGRRVSKTDLDECNGRFDRYRKYRYHVTTEFPYTIGCFKGIPIPGYGGACACNQLATPCPNQPPGPSRPPTRRKRSVASGSSYGNMTALECCSSAATCDHLYHSKSSAEQPLNHVHYFTTLFVSLTTIFMFV